MMASLRLLQFDVPVRGLLLGLVFAAVFLLNEGKRELCVLGVWGES